MTSEDRKDTFWFCLDHHRVESFEQSDSKNRLGPYDSADEAAGALDRIAAREQKWEQEDRDWNG
jgi:hypothetical protein